MQVLEMIRERAEAVFERAKAVFSARDVGEYALFMREVYSDLDVCVADLHENFPPPFELACAKGCYYCCHSHVSVSVPEAVYLVMEIKKRISGRDRRGIFKRCAKRAELGHSHAEIFRIGLPCPLLKAGECLAYELRPLACRGCNSMNCEICSWGFNLGKPETLISRYAPQMRAAVGYREALIRAVNSCSLEAVCEPLAALLPALISQENTCDNWFAGADPSGLDPC